MFVRDLEERGLIHQTSSAELASLMDKEKLTVYAGFDPTADSLHVGHLLPLITLKRAALFGHHPIALIGGATGLIGDPSGKSAERNLISSETVATNVAAVSAQIKRIVPEATVLNNADWFNQINILDFLRNTGKHFGIGAMLARDAVKSRLGTENGISFTEFAYILLQAHDFLHLNKTMGCRLQIGGSDQWGNISSGIDLIRRAGREAFGLTMPLLTNSNGEKFGKTVKGAVWLDAAKTTPNELFQFFFNTPDADVIKLIKFFTLTELDVAKLEAHTKEKPELRMAQTVLAVEACNIIHGTDGKEIPSVKITPGTKVVDALIQAGFCHSRSDARQQIKQRGVKLNDSVVLDDNQCIDAQELFTNPILGRGKKLRAKLIM